MTTHAKKYTLTVTPEQEGKRLDHVLAEWLPEALGQPLSKGKVRKLVIAGAVYLNGSRVRIASKPLRGKAPSGCACGSAKARKRRDPGRSAF